MKKSAILAAAVAIATTGSAMAASHASNSMYGNIRLGLMSADQISVYSGKFVLGYKGGYDLGNGLKASYGIELENDSAQAESNKVWTNDQSWISLSGDFGSAWIGTFGDFAGFACGDTDIFQQRSGNVCGVGAANGNLGNAIAYSGGAGAVEFGVGVRFNGSQTVKNDDTTDTVIAAKFDGGDFYVGGQITNLDTTPSASIMVLGGGVSLGEGTLGVTYADNDAATNSDAIAIAYSMPMADGTLKVGLDTGDALKVGTDSGDIINVQYDTSLSKMVYAGAQFSTQDITASDDIIVGYIGVKF